MRLHKPHTDHGSRLTTLLAPCLLALLFFGSCVDTDEFPDTPTGNFEALWKIMDEHYCFFSYKQEQLGVDWQEVHERYAKMINEGMTESQLFEVLTNMIGELRDGHVNIYAPFNTGRNWSWKEDYPSNVSDTLLRSYLGTDYRMANGLKYRLLDDNIGYIRCETFNLSFGSGNLDDALAYLAPCTALIIDIRDNGGGQLTSAEQLAGRFTNETLTVGYMQHKTGKGHNDFSSPEKQQLKPGKGIRWQKPVAVLTNRGVYSAANEFVKYMRCCKNVTVIGDRTGGGSGLPFNSGLPNGWTVRFSACPMYDRDMQSTESGIDPDVNVSLSDADFHRGKDTIIEAARRLLKEKNKK